MRAAGAYLSPTGTLCHWHHHRLVGGYAFWGVEGRGVASAEDILLLFIYLELGAMVGIYFRTNRLPVRFLIYVAITALTP